MKSWRTTLAGVCAIVAALAVAGSDLAAGHAVNLAALVPAVLSGFGLIAARDNCVTSEQAGAK